MFRVYISYAPEDVRVLAELLKWLEPLRQKYFLNIFYNRYNKYDTDNFFLQKTEVHSGNLYLFLTSYHSVALKSIQGHEVPAALARFDDRGEKFVKIHPILVSPSHWKDNSRLLLFKKNALPISKELSRFEPIEDGYLEIIETLQVEIEAMRMNLIEEATLKGQSIDGYTQEYILPKAKAPSRSAYRMKKLQEFLWACLLLFLIYSLYQIGCTDPLRFNQYTPPMKNEKPVEYKPPVNDEQFNDER